MAASAIDSVLDPVVASLRATLGGNLHSCILYGSAVRGDLVPGVSDINLLIVLQESTCEAHLAIAEAIPKTSRIDPFVLGLRGFDRSVRAFAAKFVSIRRNYRVLHGVDLLAALQIEPSLERFLCEQALRNLRLRHVRAFIIMGKNRTRYQRFLREHDAALFVHLSELVRLNDISVPKEFADRISVLEETLGIDGTPLRELLELKRAPHRLGAEEIRNLHAGIFALLDTAVGWLEKKWPDY